MVRVVRLLAVAASAGLLTGCGGTQFRPELNVKARPTAIRSAGSTTVRIPEQEPFSIALPTASKEPGLGGEALADAHAYPNGTADVSATVNRSGTAEGVFRVGHAFLNETDQQMDLEIRVRCRYEFEAENKPESLLPDVLVGLRVLAQTQSGRRFRDLGLVDYSTEAGSTRGAAEGSRSFVVTLGPGDIVNVIVAGRVRAEVSADRSAGGALFLRGLEFEVLTRPAPPVWPADQARPGAPPTAPAPEGRR